LISNSPNGVISKNEAKLVVIVDTEEDFDWSRAFSRDAIQVRSMRSIGKAQAIFDEHSITPTYVMDYPVASQQEGYRPLQEVYQSGRCLIGAHLHPWVNPPFAEAVSTWTSFAGNLPYDLEASKLQNLSDLIGERFGKRPSIYKAGRYGIGPRTPEILEELGFEVDLSVCPRMDYSDEGGPDFTKRSAWPSWFGRKRRLLELPLTVGFSGILRHRGPKLHRTISSGVWDSMHTIGVMARLRLLDKIWLSPEGYTHAEHVRLVKALYKDGLRVFTFAFHSPSLEPGNTPYVTSQSELEKLLTSCRRFFDFFMGDLGGRPVTPLQLRKELLELEEVRSGELDLKTAEGVHQRHESFRHISTR
jgi:hypothetical protein